MNIDRDLNRRSELLTRREFIKAQIETYEALKRTGGFVNKRDVMKLQETLANIEAELKAMEQ